MCPPLENVPSSANCFPDDQTRYSHMMHRSRCFRAGADPWPRCGRIPTASGSLWEAATCSFVVAPKREREQIYSTSPTTVAAQVACRSREGKPADFPAPCHRDLQQCKTMSLFPQFFVLEKKKVLCMKCYLYSHVIVILRRHQYFLDDQFSFLIW